MVVRERIVSKVRSFFVADITLRTKHINSHFTIYDVKQHIECAGWQAESADSLLVYQSAASIS